MHARFVAVGIGATALALGLASASSSVGLGVARGTTEETIVALLARERVQARVEDVAAIDPLPRGALDAVRPVRFVALGRAAGSDERDLHVLSVQVTPNRRVLALVGATDLTRSPGADESGLTVADGRAAFSVVTARGTEAVTLLDFHGESAALTRRFGPFERAATAVTSWQRTGQLEGVAVHRFELASPVPGPVELSLDGSRLRASLGGQKLEVDARTGRPYVGAELVATRPVVKGRPQLIGWTVDTLRAVSWIGPRRIEWLEHKVFLARDWIQRTVHRAMPDASSEEIARDMGLGGGSPAAQGPATAAAPPAVWDRGGGGARLLDEATLTATGWPPEPLVPMPLPKRYATEGAWVPLEEDEFVPGRPGAPPHFVTTWLRADRERQYARVYVVAWDPRAIELKIRAGASEPVDETGASGTGQVPRDPTVMRRLVGAFNGGFQSVHGEWGLQEDGHLYLPPRPWAATVAELADGSVGFGTWPPDRADVPAEITAFRQNLTPLVADGRFNPYGRSWWGAAPPQAPDQVHTVRTGVCLMQDGFVAYLWGNDLSHEALGTAMQLARCEYGVHLDMNMGLCGFELYRVLEKGSLAALGRAPERDFEATGEVEDAPGLEYRARRLTRSMNSMNFPRHIGREARDFFYLLARPRLPGPDLVVPGARAGEGRWSVVGLPHNGYPWAFARTSVRPLAARPEAVAWLLRIDPDRVATGGARPGAIALGAIVSGAGGAAPAVVRDRFVVDGPALGASPGARAAVGLDPEGFLVVAEGPDAEVVAAALSLAGVADPRALGPGGHVEMRLEEGTVGRLSGETSPPAAEALTLWADGDTPEARRLFAEVPFAPPRVWQERQNRRIRPSRR